MDFPHLLVVLATLRMLGGHHTYCQSKNGFAPGTAGQPLPLCPYLRADSWTNYLATPCSLVRVYVCYSYRQV